LIVGVLPFRKGLTPRMWFAEVVTLQLQKGKIAVHSDIVTFQHNNQPVTTSHEIARLTDIPHDMVLRSIRTMKGYYEELDQLPAFDRDFIVMTDKILNCNNAENSKRRKRGRPSIVYLLTKEGSLSFIGSLRGKKACEFRIAIANAFVRMEQVIQNELPRLQARIIELEANLTRKALPGARTGMISAPVLTPNLWGEDEIVGWELRPKDTLDEYMLTLASLRHCNKVAEGLEDKKRELTDKLVNEELSRRATITDLTERRFKLLKSKKDK